MEEALVELKKILIKNLDKVIEEAKNTNEIEASLKTVCIYACAICKIIFNLGKIGFNSNAGR